MSEFALATQKVQAEYGYDVLESQFENGASQRRLIQDNMLTGFILQSPALTYTQFQIYLNFFKAKYGILTSFTYMSPMDSTEYTVTFQKGSFKATFQSGFYVCSFRFKIL